MKKVTNTGGNIRLRNRGHKRGYVYHANLSLQHKFILDIYIYIYQKWTIVKKTIKIKARENINVFILVYLEQKEVDKQKHLIIKRN